VAIDAVIFDLDGVLVDSEPTWDDVRRRYVADRGGRWVDGAEHAMLGMATAEWSQYIHDELGVSDPAPEIAEAVIAGMEERYSAGPPFVPGALDAVRRMAARWPLGLASSSPVRVIASTIEAGGLTDSFRVTRSTEQAGAGKPDPAVYLQVAAELGVPPDRCAAVEDSTNGIRSASAAGMRVIAIPTRSFPASEEALGLAAAVLPSLDAMTEAVVEASGGA
jgi:beta-phosphoglucomutase-like phosphatase (HAD superfamily)